MTKHKTEIPGPLSVNFTKSTLRRAIKAKRRHDRQLAIKELFQMKTLLKKPLGLVMMLSFVILGGAGVYAAANWFGGVVKVTSDDSVMTVDLTKCESRMPPGVEPTSDRMNIKFKITGSPHISAEELQRKLLINCEFDSVLQYYQSQFGAVGTPPAIIKAVNTQQNEVAVGLKWGGKDIEKTFSLANAQVVDKGRASSLGELKPGDYIVFAYKSTPVNENEDPFDGVSEILGVFKTQYDTREFLEDGKSLYSANNIMPLDQYNQLHQK